MRGCKYTAISFFIFCLVLITAGNVQAFGRKTPEEKRERIQVMVKETMAELYKVEPTAKIKIDQAAGYAVFGNFGMKIFVAGGGTGYGIAFNQKTGTERFMRMVEVQAGIGLGIKKFKLIWVFETEERLNAFIDSGWEFGAQATAEAKYDDKGIGYAGALPVSKGVWLYQLTDDGLALELTAKGTRYFKDKKLN